MTNILTASDLANYLPDVDTSAYSATTLSGIIAQATRRMAAYCNVKAFDFANYTDTDRAIISNEGELIVFARVRPIVNVRSITLKRGGFSTTLTITDTTGAPLYQIPDPSFRVHFPNTYLYLTGTYLAGGSSQLFTLKGANMFAAMNYDGGYQTIPDDLKDACALWVQDIIGRRLNRAGASSFTQGRMSMAFSQTNKNGESRLISEAKSILTAGDYVRLLV